jgi:glycosyltransferase 2 family protein
MRRHHVFAALRLGLAVLVLAAVTIAIARNWAEVSADIRRVPGQALTLAAVLCAVPPILTMLGWRIILADLGSPLHLAPAGGVFYVGQLGKYLPGSVWSVVAQAEMGARLHIPRRRSAVVGLVSVGLAAICGLIVGLPALPLLFSRNESASSAGWVLLLVLPLMAVAFWPRLLNWGIARGLRLMRREALEHELSGRAVLLASLTFIAAWLASGLHVFVLSRSIAAGDVDLRSLVLASVAGFALASSLAMFSVILPAGLGIREGLLVLLLASVISPSTAAAVVVLSRFLTVVADVVFALLGWAWARQHHLITSRAERERDHVVVDEDVAG